MAALDGSIYFPIIGRPGNIGPFVCTRDFLYVYLHENLLDC